MLQNKIYIIPAMWKRIHIKKGDLITPLTEQVEGLLGETAWIPEDDKYIQNGDIGLVIPFENVLDKNTAIICYHHTSLRTNYQLELNKQRLDIHHQKN